MSWTGRLPQARRADTVPTGAPAWLPGSEQRDAIGNLSCFTAHTPRAAPHAGFCAFSALLGVQIHVGYAAKDQVEMLLGCTQLR